jgi:monovalent cation/proton antiporter MnhG/PhaG subunit
MTGTIAVEILLAIAVITALLCCLGMLIMPDFFERLHYMASVTTVSAFCILIAVAIQEGWGQATVKTILVCLVLLLINAVLTHATARAARVRALGHWTHDPDENIPGTNGVGGRQSQRERKKNE